MTVFLAAGRELSSRTTFMDHFRGSGQWTEFIDGDPRREPRAVQAFENHMRMFDQWLYDRVRGTDPWPALVARTATRARQGAE